MNHHFVIESAVVVPALRSYVENYHSQQYSAKVAGADSKNLTNNTICRLLKSEDVSKYWQSFCDLLPLHRERMWSSLENGLLRYLHVSAFFNGIGKISVIYTYNCFDRF